ncbi:hypothetical protein [Chlorobium sp.]|jgi:hypothetical protein|uniref:hypothetical protein n=1 Tax=Chlorobium sp. TaxID=1095 RepID=UPI003C4A78C3|nr:hypothetical protein [Chlorobiaceae bacterium]
MKKTAQLTLLEKTVKELGFGLRYEKGNFLGGECRLREDKVVVVNKFLPLEGKIYTLAQVISRINPPGLSPDVTKIIDKLVVNNLFSGGNDA